jgi:hypothetical protein
MDFEHKKANQATLTFSAAELNLLSNALNEICNGIPIGDDEFQTRLGADRKTARKLLADVGYAIGQLAK